MQQNHFVTYGYGEELHYQQRTQISDILINTYRGSILLQVLLLLTSLLYRSVQSVSTRDGNREPLLVENRFPVV